MKPKTVEELRDDNERLVSKVLELESDKYMLAQALARETRRRQVAEGHLTTRFGENGR